MNTQAGKRFFKKQQGTNAMDKIVKIKADITPIITIIIFNVKGLNKTIKRN